MRPIGRREVFECSDVAITEDEWDRTEGAKAAIDETPAERDAADWSGNEGEWDYAGTSDEAEGDDPLVADGLDVRTDECNRKDEVCEGQPISAISKEGVLSVCDVKCSVDALDPGKQMGGLGWYS